jgi:uncharacterized membrane protein
MAHHGCLTDTLNILMRILHIFSAVLLAGGAIAWRYGAIPAAEPLGDDVRRKVGDAMARAWRPFVLFAIAGILISGTYNLMRKIATVALLPAYHAIIGIKILLALHVLAVMFLVTRPGNEKRARQLTGVVFSAVLIVVLSAVLRWLTQ